MSCVTVRKSCNVSELSTPLLNGWDAGTQDISDPLHLKNAQTPTLLSVSNTNNLLS